MVASNCAAGVSAGCSGLAVAAARLAEHMFCDFNVESNTEKERKKEKEKTETVTEEQESNMEADMIGQESA